MSAKIAYALLATLLALHYGDAGTVHIVPRNVPISPYTMYDQAVIKLQELKQIVLTSILTAHNQLESSRATHSNYADQILSRAEAQLQDESSKLDGNVDDMKNLAESAGININSCTRTYVPQLDRLHDTAVTSLNRCVLSVSDKVNANIKDGLTEVDSTNTKVAAVEGLLGACTSGSILCLSPVVRQIDAYKIELPEAIESQVHKTSGLVGTLTIQTDACSSSSISTYMTEAGTILSDFENCVNYLLS